MNQTIRLGLYVLAILSLVSRIAMATPAIDISGVRLGMSGADARSAIARANSDFQVAALKSGTGNINGYEGVIRGRYGVPSERLFALLDGVGAVWYIGREQTYADSERPTVNATWAALTQKYGPPSARSETSGAEWDFDRSGTVVRRILGTDPLPCREINQRRGGIVQTLWIPEEVSNDCGQKLAVTVGNDFAAKLVTGLGIYAFDMRMFDAMQSKLEAERLENLRRQREQREKNLTPRL